ncbi:hypothetical protein CVT25_012558, partial [Psilocybe cyanescens]
SNRDVSVAAILLHKSSLCTTQGHHPIVVSSRIHEDKKMRLPSVLVFFALSARSVYGWGASGHMAIGYIAMPFLAPKALSFVKSSLGATYNESLGPAATWADEVKSTAAYAWSSNLHFVDAEGKSCLPAFRTYASSHHSYLPHLSDNPPTSCSVDEERDCADGRCILSALANYTTRVLDTSLDDMQIQEALKFLVYWRYRTAAARRGHRTRWEHDKRHMWWIQKQLAFRTSSLLTHRVHILILDPIKFPRYGVSISQYSDPIQLYSGIINKLLVASYNNSVTTWASALAGEYNSLAGDWISCSSTDEPLIQRKRSIQDDISGILGRRDDSDIVPLECPIVWARDSNSFDCSFVFNFAAKQDLCNSTYSVEAIPIIETQIAKQGLRLAAWLNVLFDGEPLTPIIYIVFIIRTQFLSPKALAFVKSSLGATYNESLGPAATWADDVKSEAAFSWSSALHFVDAEGSLLYSNYCAIMVLTSCILDNPPTSCSVVESRDCSNGRCILTAIANYTTRVVDKSLSAEQLQEALKFLGRPTRAFISTQNDSHLRGTPIQLIRIDHFIGDITQPLHVEALEVGGNDISVKCSGSTSNLHSVSHSGIINKLVKANYGNSVTTWANTLVSRIQSGEYKSISPSWLSCSSTTTPVSQRRSVEDDIADLFDKRATITPLECPLVWAQDSNSFDCSFVFNFTSSQDLCTSSYFTNAVPIIETQIAKGGLRLAAWLNVLFDGATNLP